MKPLNHKKRNIFQLQFLFVFLITLTLIFCSSLFAIHTGKKGIDVLEKKHAEYNAIFEKQASITFKLDEITKYLHKLKNKKRTLGEHKQFQSLISNMRTEIANEIDTTESSSVKNYKFQLYSELLVQIKDIQTMVDVYEDESEEYLYNKELLEKCRQKYRADEVTLRKK